MKFKKSVIAASVVSTLGLAAVPAIAGDAPAFQVKPVKSSLGCGPYQDQLKLVIKNNTGRDFKVKYYARLDGELVESGYKEGNWESRSPYRRVNVLVEASVLYGQTMSVTFKFKPSGSTTYGNSKTVTVTRPSCH